jgi:hypothetical protein
MAVIVVAASTATPTFCVINFENNTPRSATAKGYGGGNVVDCYGVLAAVGDWSGGSFTLYNLLLPPSPIWVSVCDTGLSNINAIAISDKYVLACGMASSNNPAEGTDPVGTVVLVDITNPVVPSVVSTYQKLRWACPRAAQSAAPPGWLAAGSRMTSDRWV